jgi:hypothetical protein
MSRGNYSSNFLPFEETDQLHPAVRLAEEKMADAHIEDHDFFNLATGNRQLISIWVAQELFVTNPFAILLLGLARRLENVHLRSLVVAVAAGEHSLPKSGVAVGSHPWLLFTLAKSMNIDLDTKVELRGTRAFLATLESSCERSTIAAVGALGVGNEALLVPEYGRMLEVFKASWPEVGAEKFLNANINEDRHHARLMGQLATAILREGASERDYLAAADAAVAARVDYYDGLLAYDGGRTE